MSLEVVDIRLLLGTNTGDGSSRAEKDKGSSIWHDLDFSWSLDEKSAEKPMLRANGWLHTTVCNFVFPGTFALDTDGKTFVLTKCNLGRTTDNKISLLRLKYTGIVAFDFAKKVISLKGTSKSLSGQDVTLGLEIYQGKVRSRPSQAFAAGTTMPSDETLKLPVLIIPAPKGSCTICMEKDVDTRLDPCGHAGLCNSCAQKTKTCPFCRTDISNRQTLFLC